MAPVQSPAGMNIQCLEQGVELIRRLDNELYADCPQSSYHGGVGAQFRHCLDFYECLLRDLPGGRIDYSRRERDPEVETDREHAIRKTREICTALRELGAEEAQRTVDVKAEEPLPNTPEWGHSCIARELHFLLSHTIHHYALIAVMLKLQGFDVFNEFPEFGVAPSTLTHWKATGSFAG